MNWVNKEKSYLYGWIDGVEDTYEEFEMNEVKNIQEFFDEIRPLGPDYIRGYMAGRRSFTNAKLFSESKEHLEYLVGI